MPPTKNRAHTEKEMMKVTVRLAPDLHGFLSDYSAKRGLSLGSFFAQYAYEIYMRDQERELDQKWKQAQIVESKIKLKKLMLF